MSSAALQSTPSPIYPATLETELAHADCLARAVESLLSVESPSEAPFVWLLGRAEEIRAYVGELTHEWSQGRIDTGPACEAMALYLAGLHATLEQWYGKWYYPSCCGPYSQVHEHSAHNLSARARLEPESEVRRAASPRKWSQLAETQTMTIPAIETDAPTVKVKAIVIRESGIDVRERAVDATLQGEPMPAREAEPEVARECEADAEPMRVVAAALI